MKRVALALAAAVALALPFPAAAEGGPPQIQARRPRIALVLEGGGALGIAHVGVLKVLEDLGVPVDIVAGTSMGALVGGLYASGNDARSIEALVDNADWSELFFEDSGLGRRTVRSDIESAQSFAEFEFDREGIKSKGGLVEGRRIIALFDRATLGVPSYADFDELPRKFRAVATDLETGKEVDFASGNLPDAMRASMSFPAIFSPYAIQGRYLVDGGVVNNLPVDVAKAMGADAVIAVHLVGGTPYDPKVASRSPIDAAMRSLDQLTRFNTTSRLAMADFVINVDLEGYWITDFAKSKEILAAGEAAARAREGDIRAFLAKLGVVEAGSPAKSAPRPFSAVRVEGSLEPRDRVEAERTFAGAVGMADPDAFLSAAYDRLDRLRKYDSIRLGSAETPEGRILVVSLEKSPPPGNSFKLGLAYSGYYSGSISNRLTVTPGVVFRGFPSEGSELQFSLPLFDDPGAAIDLTVPITEALDARASVSGRAGYETYYDASAANYQYETKAASNGLFLETGGLRHLLLSLGMRFDAISSDDISGIYPCPTVRRASLVVSSAEYRRIDHPVLPSSGLDMKAEYVLSLRELGSERYFQTISGKTAAYCPLGGGWSLGIKGIAGTDFSDGSSDSLSAPLHYKPTLSDRTLFPAPLKIDETMGALVAGTGLELKVALSRPAGLVNIPLYGILDTAAGTAIQGRSELESEGLEFHADASLGIGARVDDAFGLIFRLGVNRNSEGKYKPFFAADIGSIPL